MKYTMLIVNNDENIHKAIKQLEPLITLMDISILDIEKTGIIALGKVEAIHPDIVLLNLWVPFMDGFGLLHEMEKRNLTSKVIILNDITPYPNSLERLERYKNCYLLPEGGLQEGTFGEVLECVKYDIEHNRTKSTDNNQREFALAGECRTREDAIMEIFNGISRERLHTLSKQMSLDILSCGFYLMFADFYDRQHASHIERDSVTVKQSVITQVYQVLGQDRGWDVVDLGALQICIVINHVLDDSSIDTNDLLSRHYSAVRAAAEQQGYALRCFVSDRIGSAAELHDGFVRTKELKRYRFFNDSIEVITWNHVKACMHKIDLENIDPLINAIEHAILENDRLDMKGKLEELFLSVLQPSMDFEAFHYTIERINNMFERIANQRQITKPIYILIDSSGSTIRQVYKRVLEDCKNLQALLNNDNPIISRAIQYIRKNVKKELSLEIVANAISINSAYLSYLFKRVTREKFTDYISRIRIERAKALLKGSNMKVSEVAAEVGFQNTRYFGQVFKKITGNTPSEYQRITHQGEEQL